MNLDLAADANLVAESTVRFDHRRLAIPVFVDFDFLQNVDAIFAAIAVAAFGHVCEPLFR
jgi:hypothetical protein